MEEREKANLSGQFIETLLSVPVSICPNRLREIETCLGTYLPDFLKTSVPFFITESIVNSFEPQVLYHITDFLNFHFNLFLYEGRSKVFMAGPYLTHQPDDDFCERTLQANGKNLSLLVPFRQYCLTLPVITNSDVYKRQPSPHPPDTPQTPPGQIYGRTRLSQWSAHRVLTSPRCDCSCPC